MMFFSIKRLRTFERRVEDLMKESNVIAEGVYSGVKRLMQIFPRAIAIITKNLSLIRWNWTLQFA